MKSRLDILLDRYVITEKTLEASCVFSTLQTAHKDAIRFMTMLDSNKFVMILYPDDKHVEIHLRIVLKISEFDSRVIDMCNAELKTRLNEQRTDKIKTSNLVMTSIETITDKYYIFGYKLVTTGTIVLDSMLKDRFENSMRLEALRVEKEIVQYGR